MSATTKARGKLRAVEAQLDLMGPAPALENSRRAAKRRRLEAERADLVALVGADQEALPL